MIKRHQRHQLHTLLRDKREYWVNRPTEELRPLSSSEPHAKLRWLRARSLFAAGIERAIEESTFYNLEFLCWRIYIWSSESTTSTLISVSLWASGDCGCTTGPGPPSAAARPHLTDRRKTATALTRRRAFWNASVGIKQSLNNWETISHHLCLIMMVVTTKGCACARAVARASTRLPTHARSCYCMNDSCSVTAPAPWKSRLMMLSTDRGGEGERRGRREKEKKKKKNLTEDLRELRSHWGKMSRTLCSKKRRDLKWERREEIQCWEPWFLKAVSSRRRLPSMMNGERRETEQ